MTTTKVFNLAVGQKIWDTIRAELYQHQPLMLLETVNLPLISKKSLLQIPPEHLFPLYGIIAGSIIGWPIPNIIGGAKAKIQRKYLKECVNQIGNGASSHRHNCTGINCC